MKCKSYILFILLMFFFHFAKSTTWITIENGNWGDSSVWSMGIVPAYSISDTIIFKDTVYFDDDIYLNSGAYMQIDSMGGALCGHHNITVLSGATLNKYGALNLDTLFVTGGTADFQLPGPYLMWLTRISQGGSMHISSSEQSCLCSWDTCFVPIPFIIPPVIPEIIHTYDLFPNPSNGNFNLQYTQPYESSFNFYNALGQKLFSTAIEGTSGIKNFSSTNLSNGMYYWEIISGDKVYKKGKHIIIN